MGTRVVVSSSPCIIILMALRTASRLQCSLSRNSKQTDSQATALPSSILYFTTTISSQLFHHHPYIVSIAPAKELPAPCSFELVLNDALSI